MLGAPIAIYIISHIIYPSSIDGVDLESHYFQNSTVIWSIGAAAIVFSTLLRPIMFGSSLLTADNATSFIGLGVLAILATIPNKQVHRILLLVIFGLLMADILVFTMLI